MSLRHAIGFYAPVLAAALCACDSSDTARSTTSSGNGGSAAQTTGNGFMSGGGDTAGAGGSCNPALVATIRDFKKYDGGDGHPDFETFGGDGLKGIVKDTLGDDHKPVYAHDGPTEFTTGKTEFDQWYRDTEGVNIPLPFTIVPTVDQNGNATYQNNAFFPIDDQGWGNQGDPHNFAFTTELHMTFVYKGGDTFSFTGDDDLWVFMNNKLAIDLGGLHSSQSDMISLDDAADELGIEIGKEYPLDLFHAERHTTESNFSIQSSLQFTNCTPIVF